MSVAEAINRMDKLAQEGLCPLCKENRGRETELDEIKKTKNGGTKVAATCPECSFETVRNHD